ncbi:MAG TPA: hypothetical protein VMV23_06970 [Candidatus Nanopelagicaceae bacterium]|nr:hypothetical protein [Candidatus Nanopelagicaceae bacterium]
MGLLRRKQRPIDRLGASAADAAGAVAEVIGTGVRSAGESMGPALAAATHQVPEFAGRLAEQIHPMADSAQRHAVEAVEMARERSSDLAEKVVQAAYEATKSLPPDTRKRVLSSLAKTGIKPPAQKRHGISKKWMAAGLFATAGVAFLFSGTVQDKVYDLVDRLRGEDLDTPLGGYPPVAPAAANGAQPVAQESETSPPS